MVWKEALGGLGSHISGSVKGPAKAPSSGLGRFDNMCGYQ